MAKETTYAGMLGDLQKLVTALSANSGELTHLEGARTKLERLLTQAQEVATTTMTEAGYITRQSEQVERFQKRMERALR